MAIITQKQKKKLIAWDKAKKELDEAKAKEAECFSNVIDLIFPDRVEGAQKIPIGGGYYAHCTQGYNRKLDPDELKSVLKELPRGVKKKCVKTSVALIKSGYDSLSDEHRDIFDRCVTSVPRKPSLKIVEPKEEDRQALGEEYGGSDATLQ
jgi:hypothetical protein